MRACSFIWVILILLSSCKKDGQIIFKNVKGNLTAAGGCQAWLIRVDANNHFQPLNLNDFQITLKSGQPVIFSFYINDMLTFCQDGPTIQLLSIQDQ
jgi:hypothetical protein